MRNVFTLLCLMGILHAAQGQAIYYTNFNNLTGWSASPAGNVELNQTVTSQGAYNGPPLASGGNNAKLCDGTNNTTVTFTSPIIPTIGHYDIIVGFGAWKSNWNEQQSSVKFSYTIDGVNWIVINGKVDTLLLEDDNWQLLIFMDELANAENQQSVQFKFEYETNGNNCNKLFRIDDFTVGINFNLPVEITAFEATPVPGKRWVDLRWSTASEKDNAYFEIERSSDEGRQYDVIGTVPGAGTTALPQFYTFEDRSAPCGTPIYRLRQVDTDQAYSYSPARAVRLHCSGAQLQPTLVQDRLQVVWDEDTDLADARWQLIGPTGRVVSEGAFAEEAAGSYAIYVAGLPEGWYFLRVQSDRYTETLPFIKQ